MPYIEQEQRRKFDKLILRLSENIETAGELNYVLTKICHNAVYPIMGFFSYQDLNRVIGVLESAKQEFYRTVVAPYEDQKRKENGSVSELDK